MTSRRRTIPFGDASGCAVGDNVVGDNIGVDDAINGLEGATSR